MVTFLEELQSKEFQNKLKKIYELLEEATKHSEDTGNFGKSSECEVTIIGPAWFYKHEQMTIRPMINIYSYMLGPYRNHGFENIDEALEAVEYWYNQELSMTDPADYTYPDKQLNK